MFNTLISHLSISSKQPLVGHNMMMDLLHLHEKFFRPLPGRPHPPPPSLPSRGATRGKGLGPAPCSRGRPVCAPSPGQRLLAGSGGSAPVPVLPERKTRGFPQEGQTAPESVLLPSSRKVFGLVT